MADELDFSPPMNEINSSQFESNQEHKISSAQFSTMQKIFIDNNDTDISQRVEIIR